MKRTIILLALSLLFLTANLIAAEPWYYDYARLTPPAAWTMSDSAPDYKFGSPTGYSIFTSPSGTVLRFSNFGYDMSNPQAAFAYHTTLPENRLVPKTNAKKTSYGYFEGTNHKTGLPTIWISFTGYRYQGTMENPSATANALVFEGKNLAADKTAIESLLQNLQIEPRKDYDMIRYTPPQGGYSFEVPKNWTRAAMYGTFGKSNQFIHPDGPYLYTEYLQDVTATEMIASLKKNGYAGYPKSSFETSKTWKTSTGQEVTALLGGSQVPINSQYHTWFTVVVVPYAPKMTGFIIMLGEVGDPAFIQRLLESVRIGQ